ncbi:hypothetical protein BX661DRAFT_181373 [Kickxella alabastrina]|uniref:uncharacterized protein n=1 Tax=Kickxella alabastrina TaxID=61397 RepID=UPI0022211CE4|nr:uncharacterized protein BX661DRAFT_181373 [Kickxella alabastrina]KAI7829098.1 hypothetical protein BX661DRAFT_181373 [Kickxella alabastrina]
MLRAQRRCFVQATAVLPRTPHPIHHHHHHHQRWLTTAGTGIGTNNTAASPPRFSQWIDGSSGKLNTKALESKWKQRPFYVLVMFPYPSGALHMGHVRVYTISDTVARFQRMRGRTVVHPMGWDAFGLPAENAAIERQQLVDILADFDWQRELATCDASYYRWTQDLFLRMLDHGMAETVLANEQGRSWRSGAVVERKRLEQWFARITRYADDLLGDLDQLEWPEHRNWIGRSEGAQLTFNVAETPVDVFTTRADTVFGVARKHLPHDTADAMSAGPGSAETGRELTAGCFTGLWAEHPLVAGRRVPVWLASYVVPGYGTGAVMGVPAHDARDRDFSARHAIPTPGAVVIDPSTAGAEAPGVLRRIPANGAYGGMTSGEAQKAIVRDAAARGRGHAVRYWGAPVPIIHCSKCGAVPDLPVKLPANVALSGRGGSPLAACAEWCPLCQGAARRDTDTLDTFVDSSWYFLRYLDAHNNAAMFDSHKVSAAMPVDVYVGGVEHAILHLLKFLWKTKAYGSGSAADLDLARVRAREAGAPQGEPFRRLLTQGMVHGLTHKDPETGRFLRPDERPHPRIRATGQRPTVSYEKMSKSKYNGVAPGDAVEAFGADATRLHMLYLARRRIIVGMQRWINRLGRLMDSTCGAARASDAGLLPLDLADGREKWSPEARETFRMCNVTVQRVTDALQRTYAFNSAIAALIELSNYLSTVGDRSHPTFRHALLTLVKMLSPMAPGVGEELWEIAHENYLLPYSDSSSGGNSGVINGKVRFKMECMPEELLGAVRNHSASVKWLVDPKSGAEKIVVKTVCVPNKLINLIIQN